MPSRASLATIESRIVAGFIWVLAGWTVCVHLAVVLGESFAGLIGFTPIAFLMASLGLGLTWRCDEPSGGLEYKRPAISWFLAAALVLLSLLFGYFTFWLLAAGFIFGVWWFADNPAQIAAPTSENEKRRDRRRLILLCFIAIALPLLLHQPDKDDAFYLSVATDAIRHPDRAIWSTDTIHDNAKLPVFLPIYKTEAFEHLISLVAKVAHCSCIRADHTLLPMILAVFVMLAWTTLARTIDPYHWFGITLTAALIMLLTGASRSSPGNFAFTRLQQGKSVFAAGIVPVLCVYAWRVVHNGGWRNVLLLIAAQIAGAGLSSTAIVIGPLVTMAVAVLAAPWNMTRKSQTPVLRYSSAQLTPQPKPRQTRRDEEREESREDESALRGFLRALRPFAFALVLGGKSCQEDKKSPEINEEPDQLGARSGSSEYLRTCVWTNPLRICAAGISCIYPFALALLMRKQMLAVKWVEQSPLHHTSDEVKKVLGDGPQLWFFFACMLLVPLLVPRQSRRLILAPIVLLLAILINPLFTRYLQLHIFSPLTYWRGMWVVPWLIWSAAVVFTIANGNWIRKAIVYTAVILLLVWHPLISKQNDTYFHLGGLSVDADEYAVAMQLAEHTPPGTAALAPELVACWTATLDHRPPLIFVRPFYTQPNPIPGLDDMGMRNLLGKIAGEENLTDKDAAALIDGVGQYHLGAVVLRETAGKIVAQSLERSGFKPTTINDYILWIR